MMLLDVLRAFLVMLTVYSVRWCAVAARAHMLLGRLKRLTNRKDSADAKLACFAILCTG